MLTPLDESTLDMILGWRNQEEVRFFSFNDHFISKDEHYHWWQTVKNDPHRLWLLFYANKKPLGVVNFYNIKQDEYAYWGFYLSDEIKDYEKLKSWFSLEKEAIDYAINSLKLKQLKCEIFRFNKAALFMHKRSGYEEISTYQHKKGEVVVLQLQALSVNKNAR